MAVAAPIAIQLEKDRRDTVEQARGRSVDLPVAGGTKSLSASFPQLITRLFVPNVEFIVMPSRVGERARGAGLSSGRLGIIRARSGTEAARHWHGIVLPFDLRASLFRAPSLS